MTAPRLLENVLRRSEVLREQHPLWRRGQRLFEALADINRPLAFDVEGTDVDPYYDDSRVVVFFGWIIEKEAELERMDASQFAGVNN